jgi:exodeoxyribonuclease VII small subunit
MAKNSDPKPADPKPVDELTFEQALDELDALVRRMESGALGLDESIAAYRRGAALATYCQSRLNAAEQQIRKLDGEVLRTLEPDELRGGAGTAGGDGGEDGGQDRGQQA